MRLTPRKPLPQAARRYLDTRQKDADRKAVSGVLHPTSAWKAARQTKSMELVLATLRSMSGPRERCMYCLDSHATDIEHFWPKTPYPGKMFSWPNLLLCCTDCGRIKGDEFPLERGLPLLIDPTVDEPWEHLDFDPATGNIVARFLVGSGIYSMKGERTVDVLQLDRREAMATGYRTTFNRMSAIVTRVMERLSVDPDSLIVQLQEADDHGLLGWCFLGSGQNEPPFSLLRERFPDEWSECLKLV